MLTKASSRFVAGIANTGDDAAIFDDEDETNILGVKAPYAMVSERESEWKFTEEGFFGIKIAQDLVSEAWLKSR